MAKSATCRVRRSKKTELVRYLPEAVEEHVESNEIAILKNLKLGQRILVELEVTGKSNSTGPVVSLVAKEGTRKIVSAYQLCKINSIETL